MRGNPAGQPFSFSSSSQLAGKAADTDTKIAPLVTKITYIKMDPRRSIRNGFANGYIYNLYF